MPKKPASPKTTISPPEGWADAEGYGLLYGLDADGKPVPLVRYLDVFDWYCKANLMPLKVAAKTILQSWPDCQMHVYFLCKDDYAERHCVSSFEDVQRIVQQPPVLLAVAENARPMKSGGGPFKLAFAGQVAGYDPLETAQEALARGQREQAASAADLVVSAPLDLFASNRAAPKEKTMGHRLALTYHDAHRVFGWGTALGAAAGAEMPGELDKTTAGVLADGVTQSRKKVSHADIEPEWTGERLAVRQTQLKRQCAERGERNYTELLSSESGLPLREITRRIKSHKQPDPMAKMANALAAKR